MTFESATPRLNQVDLEYPTCPLCQNERRKVIYTGFGVHEVVRCLNCAVHYLYPRLTEKAMRRVYQSDNYFGNGAHGYADLSYAQQEPALRATFRRLLQNLHRRGMTGGKLLEIGCGYGYLLREAADFFDYRVGTEFSLAGVRSSAAHADEVYQGGIERIAADARFDCVIAAHVIEHSYQPLEFVERIAERTKPGGTILLAAPDMNSIWRKAMRRRWTSFKIPEHVIFFDNATLSELMRRAGLSEITPFPYPHAFPLSLVAAKLGLPFPAALGRRSIWIPLTTVALCGKVKNE